MKVLEVEDITKIYSSKGISNSTRALNGVSFSIEKGEFVGVMGPSGSGKTSLLNILSGINKPTSGRTEIVGKNINTMSEDDLSLFRRQKLGFVFQEFNLLDSLTLKENIMLPMILDKKSNEYMNNKADEIMSVFDIKDIGNKYPYEISGGQQQRVAVSRAVVNEPVIVFADEPTGNLDSKSSNAVMKLFTKMNRELESTILMVTHDAFAASFCKKIIFIKDGSISMEIISSGNRKEFFDKILNCLAVLGGEDNDL
ncbi:ABC transporter ATP-binding protein [Clostridium paraputrificum]|uniref:ABC transporter ATP-binding protein n=1 Tax=Clostridium paraputrificum TaxID=29363 RepID=UPI003D3447F8